MSPRLEELLSPGSKGRLLRAGAVVLLVLLVLAVYAPALKGAFVWDDHVLVEHDIRCQTAVYKCFGLPYFPPAPFVEVRSLYYRPLVLVSYGMTSVLAGTAQAQHAVNVALHALNALLLVFLARRLDVGPIRSFVAAAVWAVFPRLVDAVAWVAGRTDILATTFVLLGLAVWPFERKNAPRDRWGTAPVRRVAAMICMILAALSKETGFAGPATIVVAAFVLTEPAAPHRLVRNLSPGFAAIVSMAGVGAAYVILRMRAVPLGGIPDGVELERYAWALAALEALGRYAEMTARFWAPWTATGALGHVDTLRVAFGVLTAGLLTAALLYVGRRKHPAAVVGVLLTVFSVGPVLHVLPLGLHGAVTADRLLYMPLAGVALALGGAVPTRAGVRYAFSVAAGFLLVACVVATRIASPAFRSEPAFWVLVAERSDAGNTGPRSLLAVVVRDRGMSALGCRLFERVEAELDGSARENGAAHRRAREQIGACRASEGRYDESAAIYRELLRDYPAIGRLAFSLGFAELHRFRFAEAAVYFARSGELDKSLARRAALMRSEALRGAQEHARLQLQPDPIAAVRLDARLGRAVEAERAWLSVALDEAQPIGVRSEAMRYLILDGSLAAAEAAYAAVSRGQKVEARFYEQLENKRALFRTLQDVEPRIVRLAEGSGVSVP